MGHKKSYEVKQHLVAACIPGFGDVPCWLAESRHFQWKNNIFEFFSTSIFPHVLTIFLQCVKHFFPLSEILCRLINSFLIKTVIPDSRSRLLCNTDRVNTLCGQTQMSFRNKFDSWDDPPSHHLSAKVGPIIQGNCGLLFILHGHVLKQHTVAATQNRSGLFSSNKDWVAGNTPKVVHITESQNH